MSSKDSSLRPRAALLACFVLLAALACGKKGEPLPPLRYTPVAASDLAVRQRGDQLVVRVSYPQLTTAGQALPGLQAVEVLQLLRPATAAGAPAPIDARQFVLGARKIAEIGGPELTTAAQGPHLEMVLSVADPAGVRSQHASYGVRFVAKGGDVSELSNLVTLPPHPSTPGVPTGLKAEGTPTGVLLTWTTATSGPVAVYRRGAAERSFGLPIASVEAGATTWVDQSARLGERYVYAVTGLAAESPLVESALVRTVEAFYRDQFPPPPPVGLVALSEGDRARLVWEPVAAADLAGYHVYRRVVPGGAEDRLTAAPTTETSFQIEDLGKGRSFTFRVTALDASGNESTSSGEVTVP
ncbi:MAG TPA: fibronectin type III domain-containing protein [Thermoanaerobaculia bacterium]|nr:fibronectin type III domain-containing protein [Thermoanaerobaculia bacterium]